MAPVKRIRKGVVSCSMMPSVHAYLVAVKRGCTSQNSRPICHAFTSMDHATAPAYFAREENLGIDVPCHVLSRQPPCKSCTALDLSRHHRRIGRQAPCSSDGSTLYVPVHVPVPQPFTTPALDAQKLEEILFPMTCEHCRGIMQIKVKSIICLQPTPHSLSGTSA